jgi:hypothetical protein
VYGEVSGTVFSHIREYATHYSASSRSEVILFAPHAHQPVAITERIGCVKILAI